MAYYQYYQRQPGWGTSSYQFRFPSQPTFTPSRSWEGHHFFRAQAGFPNEEGDEEYEPQGKLFHSIWRGGKRDFKGSLAVDEARLWHRRVYAGLAPIGQLSAPQLGAAAGFEAYRHWTVYGSSYRGVLEESEEREREALAGMAAGEAHRLIRYIMVGQRRHFMKEAAEVAIATALRLHEENFDSDLGGAYDAQPFVAGRGHLGGHARPHVLRRRSSFAYGEELKGERKAERRSRVLAPQRTGVPMATSGGVYRQQPTTYIVLPGNGQQQAISYVSTTGQQPQVQYVQATNPGQYYPQQQQQQQQYVQQPQPQYVQYVNPQPQYVVASPQYVQQQQPPQQVVYTGQQPYATTGYSSGGYSRSRAMSVSSPRYSTGSVYQ